MAPAAKAMAAQEEAVMAPAEAAATAAEEEAEEAAMAAAEAAGEVAGSEAAASRVPRTCRLSRCGSSTP